MKTKVVFPFVFSGIIIAMLGLTVKQFTLPEKNPVTIMVILCLGGILSLSIVTVHRMRHSYTPFAAGMGPIGITLLWIATVFLGIGVWFAIRESSLQVGIVMPVLAAFLAFFGYKMLKG